MINTVEEIMGKNKLKPLKFSIGETPHSTIEPNRTCNIRCRSCYNLNKDSVKSLDKIKAEIDLLIKKRRLQVITILGGEPTLHPYLKEVIAYIKSKNLICQLLTNGVVLLQDKSGQFLENLITSGVDRILLHIDSGQGHIHKDIEQTREMLFSILEERKIHFALSLTICNEDQGVIPRIIRRYLKYKYFDGILAVLARDPLPPKIQKVQLRDECGSLWKELKLEPSAYIPSNLNDKDVCWLFYLYFINAKTGQTFGISPVFDKMMRKLYRIFREHQVFMISLAPSLYGVVSLLVCLGEIINKPAKIRTVWKLLQKSSRLRAIRFHHIVLQNPPEFNEQRNMLQMCYHCPDATIRNGKLTPVCLADKINPLDLDGENLINYRDLYQTVYEHLGEI